MSMKEELIKKRNRKRNRKWNKEWNKKLFVTGLMLSLALSGCGTATDNTAKVLNKSDLYTAQSRDMVADYGYDYGDYTGETAMEVGNLQTDLTPGQSYEVSESSAYAADRKLIRNVDLDVETRDFDGFLVSVEAEVRNLGGYVETMNTYNGSRYETYRSSRNSNLTLRIPKAKLDTFLETVSESANIIRRSENVTDVTLTYVDLESHRNALATEQERLNQLLEKAETLEDIITIEDRLSNVRYQLESMESQLRTYDNQVDYSTVTLSVQEVEELTPVEEETTGQKIVHGFASNLKAVGSGLVDFFVWFVVNIPFFAIWIFVILGIVFGIKIIIRSRKKKKAQKKEKEEKK